MVAASAEAARQQRGGSEQRRDGICSAVLATAARWQSGVSVGSAAEAEWQRRGNGNSGGSAAEAAAVHGSAAAVAAAWRQ
jgi:hypothetical protein